ncbi:hypothetical protein [Ruegeria atlantica]|uniref:hypothetical protein n=1 Tax=Ruegeria atlantica TaxID=81569 RepID=UPI0014811BDA|nr:hypothetical protein [Ruegeria atlantica]
MQNRDTYLSSFVGKEEAGMEIGPSYNPIFPKTDGWNVKTLDYLDKQGLIDKYGTKGEDVDRIEDVDYIVEGSSFASSVPEKQKGQFGFIALSHALEHLVDIIRFFKDCQEVLHEKGQVLIAIPDKRFSFDFFRPITTTGDVLRSYWANDKVHPADVLYDSSNLICTNNGHSEWVVDHEISSFDFHYPDPRREWAELSETRAKAVSPPEYIDMHRWVFTPSSFLFLMRDLLEIGAIEFEVTDVNVGEGPNIFACMKRVPDPIPFPQEDRRHLQYAMRLEDKLCQEFLETSPEYKQFLLGRGVDQRTAKLSDLALRELEYRSKL